MYTPAFPLLALFFCHTALAIPAVSTITVSSAAPTATSPSYTSDDRFEDDIVVAHNFFRDEHNVSTLTWNETSAKTAQKWVERCVFEHSGGSTGENLAAGYANVSAAVDAWANEREQYSFKKPTGFSEKTGHFTQVVWSNTTSVGCARKACNGAQNTPGFYIVCEYYPPGNVEGDKDQFFKDNVKAQVKGKNTDTVESGVTSPGSGWRDLRWGSAVLVCAGCIAAIVV